jgi:hypothetical protein
MNIALPEAINLALDKITMNGRVLDSSPPVITYILEYPWAWLVFYNSKKFSETGDSTYSYIGNVPVLVGKRDGEINYVGITWPLTREEFLEKYRMEKGYPEPTGEGIVIEIP